MITIREAAEISETTLEEWSNELKMTDEEIAMVCGLIINKLDEEAVSNLWGGNK